MTDALDSSSDMSERCTALLDLTIDSNFPQPPSVVAEDGTYNTFTLKDPNLHYQAHQRINGEVLLIPSMFVANFIDQENLVNMTAAI